MPLYLRTEENERWTVERESSYSNIFSCQIFVAFRMIGFARHDKSYNL